MKIAILSITFFLVIANGVESRSHYLKENSIVQELLKKYAREELMKKYKGQNNFNDFEDGDNWQNDLLEIQNGKSKEILNDDKNVEQNSEDEHEDLFEIQSGKPLEILTDEKNVEHNDEDEHKDLFEIENGNDAYLKGNSILQELLKKYIREDFMNKGRNNFKDFEDDDDWQGGLHYPTEYQKENSVVQELMNKYEQDEWKNKYEDLFKIQNQEPPEILNNNQNVEYNSEDEHEDLFDNKNGNDGKDIEDVHHPVMTEIEVNAMNNYEGDEMIISEENKKRGVGTDITIWPRVGGKLEIPYVIDSSITATEKVKIVRYIGNMNNHLRKCNSDNTDVWVQRTGQTNYINFLDDKGCYSYLGYLTKPNQIISLGSGCIYPGIVEHEMLHAMGFSHEQSRADRDQYVTINYQNIISDKKNNFDRLTSMQADSAKTPYDYGSVMHYGPFAFSTIGRASIVSQTKGAVIGQRNGMSATDIEDVYSVYKCGAPPTTSSPPHSGNTLAECSYNSQDCDLVHNVGWTKNSGYLKTNMANVYSFAYLTKSNFPQLSDCLCTSTGYCPRRNFCVQFNYEYTNPISNSLSNAISVYGYARLNSGGTTHKFFAPRIYAPGGSGWMTMKTTISLNCGPEMFLVVITASGQRDEVKIDEFNVKYGSC